MVEANNWKLCKCDKKEDRPFSDYNKETMRSLTAAAIQVHAAWGPGDCSDAISKQAV